MTFNTEWLWLSPPDLRPLMSFVPYSSFRGTLIVNPWFTDHIARLGNFSQTLPLGLSAPCFLQNIYRVIAETPSRRWWLHLRRITPLLPHSRLLPYIRGDIPN